MSYQKLHESLSTTDLSMFDHFSGPAVQRNVKRMFKDGVRPVSTLSSSANMEFRFRVPSEHQLVINKTKLYLRMFITLTPKDGTMKINDWDDLIPANYLLHAMFKNVEISINNKEIGSKPATYPYRAYLDAKFGFTNDAKDSHLTSALWTDTVAKRLSVMKPSASARDIRNSKEFELKGKLHLDLGFQHRAILGGSDVRIILTPHDPSFYLQFKDGSNLQNASVTFTDALLDPLYAEMDADFLVRHDAAVAANGAKFFYNNVEVRHDTIPMGSLDVSFDNICYDQTPNLFVLQLVDSEAYNGSYAKNPFNFEHFNMNYTTSYCGGHQIPQNGIHMDFDKGIFLHAFTSISEAMNQDGMDSINNISRFNYTDGNVHIAINYSPDGSVGVGSTVNPVQTAKNMRVVIRFKKPVEKALTATFYFAFDKCLVVDSTRTPLQ